MKILLTLLVLVVVQVAHAQNCKSVAWNERCSTSLKQCVGASDAEGCEDVGDDCYTCYRAEFDCTPCPDQDRIGKVYTVGGLVYLSNRRMGWRITEPGRLAKYGIQADDIITRIGKKRVTPRSLLAFVRKPPKRPLLSYFRQRTGISARVFVATKQ